MLLGALSPRFARKFPDHKQSEEYDCGSTNLEIPPQTLQTLPSRQFFQPEKSGCGECFFRGHIATPFDLVIVHAETYDEIVFVKTVLDVLGDDAAKMVETVKLVW